MKLEIPQQQLDKAIKSEISVQKKQEVEYILEGTISPRKGHKVFEVNELTGECKEASYKSDTAAFNIRVKLPPKKMVVNPDCVYIPALNSDNAKKKFKNNPMQDAYYVKFSPGNIDDITFNL